MLCINKNDKNEKIKVDQVGAQDYDEELHGIYEDHDYTSMFFSCFNFDNTN